MAASNSYSPMRSVLVSQWLKTRWILLAAVWFTALAIGALAVIDAHGFRFDAVLTDEDTASSDFMVSLMFIGAPTIIAAASVLMSHSDADRLSVGLPARALRIPMATWKLVGIHVVYGCVATAAVAGLVAVPAFLVLNLSFDWWLPMLITACTMVLLQLWAWVFGDASPRIMGASFVATVGAITWTAQREPLVALVSEGSPILVFGLAALFVGAMYGVAVALVSVLRGGGWSDRMGVGARGASRMRNRRPFRSATTAQFWYEWRQFGWLLPVFVGACALAYFWGMPLMVALFRISDTTGNSSAEGIQPLFHVDWLRSVQTVITGLRISALTGGVLVGGIMFMRAGQWNSQSKYLLTRPLSTKRIANARIMSMLASSCAAFGVLCACAFGVYWYLRFQAYTNGMVHYLMIGYQDLPRFLVVGVFWSALFGMVWVGAWSVSLVYVMIVAAVVFLPPLTVVSLSSMAGLFEDGGAVIEKTVDVCTWVAAVLLLIGLVAMAFRCERRGLVPKYYKWLALVSWIMYTGVVTFFGRRFVLPYDAAAWTMDFPYPIDWGLWVGASALPILPLFLHPLLVGRSRVN